MIDPSPNLQATPPPPFNPPPRRRAPKALIFGILIALLGGLFCVIPRLADMGEATPQTRQRAPEPTLNVADLNNRWPEIVAHAAAPARGLANAPFTMAEFGDFQCPHCGTVRPVIESILRRNPAQVNLIFLHMTWPQHEFAVPAAQASLAAAAEGKFWPMYDQLYTHQDDLQPGFYSDYAAKIGLDKARFKQAVNAPELRRKVEGSTEFAQKLGLQSTPTILLRDNARGTVTVYVGLDPKGTPMSNGTKKATLGLKNLIANPPWAVQKP